MSHRQRKLTVGPLATHEPAVIAIDHFRVSGGKEENTGRTRTGRDHPEDPGGLELVARDEIGAPDRT